MIAINGMPHQLFAAGLQTRDIYQELKNFFYKEHSDVTWEEFISANFALWIYTSSGTGNILHGSGRAVKQSGISLQIEKTPETGGGDIMCYVFSLENAVAHQSVTNILTIEN